eukprot:gene1474-12092_t
MKRNLEIIPKDEENQKKQRTVETVEFLPEILHHILEYLEIRHHESFLKTSKLFFNTFKESPFSFSYKFQNHLLKLSRGQRREFFDQIENIIADQKEKDQKEAKNDNFKKKLKYAFECCYDRTKIKESSVFIPDRFTNENIGKIEKLMENSELISIDEKSVFHSHREYCQLSYTENISVKLSSLMDNILFYYSIEFPDPDDLNPNPETEYFIVIWNKIRLIDFEQNENDSIVSFDVDFTEFKKVLNEKWSDDELLDFFSMVGSTFLNEVGRSFDFYLVSSKGNEENFSGK